MKSSTTYIIKRSSNQRKTNISYIFSWAVVIFLIGLLVYTGLTKVVFHTTFTWQLGKQPLPQWSKPILQYLIPIIELGIVALLYRKAGRAYGLLLATLMLASYSIYAYLAYSLYFGHVVCACGKVFQKMGWEAHFWFNTTVTICTAYSGYILVWRKPKKEETIAFENGDHVQKE